MSLTSLGRYVQGKVDGTRREGQLRDVGKPARIGVCSLHAHQLERRVMQRFPDGRELHLAEEERGIDLASLQGVKRLEIDERGQPRVGVGDVVGGKQRLDEGSDPASRRADRDLLAAELVQLRQRRRTAVEDPERLVVQSHEHGQVAALPRLDDPAVHEGHIHPGLRVVQELLVVLCAAGHALFDGQAFSGKDLFVALRVLVVQPVLKAGGEHDVVRDRADQEPGARQCQEPKAAQRSPRPFCRVSRLSFPIGLSRRMGCSSVRGDRRCPWLLASSLGPPPFSAQSWCGPRALPDAWCPRAKPSIRCQHAERRVDRLDEGDV